MKTYKDIQTELNVSSATIHNWIKTGVLPKCNSKSSFSEDEYIMLIDKIRTKDLKLRQGTNRSEKNNDFSNSSIVLSEKSSFQHICKIKEICAVSDADIGDLMYCLAIILLERKLFINCTITLKELKVESKHKALQKFLNKWAKLLKNNPKSLYLNLQILDLPQDEHDLLGAIYESLRTDAQKSRTGAYYTPASLCNGIIINPDKHLLDPCAGTGSLLLNMVSKNHNPKYIFLRDVDYIALNIAVVNFVLYFKNAESLINTKICDITTRQRQSIKYDYIISNPPYGAKFSNEKKAYLKTLYPELNSSESFSIAVFNSLKMLKNDGQLHFVLPESILFVNCHENIRKVIFAEKHSVDIEFFGKAFKNVMSPIIRLKITRAGNSKNIVINQRSFCINGFLHSNYQYRPPYINCSDELKFIEKIIQIKHFTLKDRCVFGLGVVTGNNKKHLVPKSKNSNLTKSKTDIYTGKELIKFAFKPAKFVIDFNPEILQQTVNISLLRESKICYKFISNELCTVFDQNGRLILNSINFFVLKDKSISSKSICSFFNSSIVNRIYKMLYHSNKILRSHIETFPIPTRFFKYQNELDRLYDLAANNEKIQKEIETICRKIYMLE